MLRQPQFVMPAWIAGIQFRRMPGDIHLSLDSNAPCWNGGVARLSPPTKSLWPSFRTNNSTRSVQRFNVPETFEV